MKDIPTYKKITRGGVVFYTRYSEGHENKTMLGMMAISEYVIDVPSGKLIKSRGFENIEKMLDFSLVMLAT